MYFLHYLTVFVICFCQAQGNTIQIQKHPHTFCSYLGLGEECILARKDPPSCYFMQDVQDQWALFEKCTKEKSSKIKTFPKSKSSVWIDDLKCGTTNATDIQHGQLCYFDNLTSNDSKTGAKCLTFRTRFVLILCNL